MLNLSPFATHSALPLLATLVWAGTSLAQSVTLPHAAAPAPMAVTAGFSMANPRLTVLGHNEVDSAMPRRVTLDMAALRALQQHSFVTRTPWDTLPVQFGGPLLRDVLKASGVQGQVIQATALNDYTATIPVADAYQFDVVLAIHINGKPIPVRSKGPFFIIYPFDSTPELQSTTYYERSIWQLKTLRIQ